MKGTTDPPVNVYSLAESEGEDLSVIVVKLTENASTVSENVSVRVSAFKSRA